MKTERLHCQDEETISRLGPQWLDREANTKTRIHHGKLLHTGPYVFDAATPTSPPAGKHRGAIDSKPEPCLLATRMAASGLYDIKQDHDHNSQKEHSSELRERPAKTIQNTTYIHLVIEPRLVVP